MWTLNLLRAEDGAAKTQVCKFHRAIGPNENVTRFHILQGNEITCKFLNGASKMHLETLSRKDSKERKDAAHPM